MDFVYIFRNIYLVTLRYTAIQQRKGVKKRICDMISTETFPAKSVLYELLFLLFKLFSIYTDTITIFSYKYFHTK